MEFIISPKSTEPQQHVSRSASEGLRRTEKATHEFERTVGRSGSAQASSLQRAVNGMAFVSPLNTSSYSSE
jgi:hypothetical protein